MLGWDSGRLLRDMTPFDPSPRPTPGFRRGKRVGDLMTHEHNAFFESSQAAERAGDAATALDYHQGIPLFRRSAHRGLLAQLASLAGEMTPWLWARWAAYQTTRAEDPGTESRKIHRMALDYALATFHGADLEEIHCVGGDPMPAIARVVGEDWAFHQICTYELGGLECFLETAATGLLVERCGLARQWFGARIGGYRLVSVPGRLAVRDLASGRQVELLDLGARVHADEDGWLIGRLVPSGTTPALMFDTRPLPVDERTARAASTGDRRGAWVSALVEGIAAGRVDAAVLQREDRELVTDVPSLGLLMRGTAAGAVASAIDQLAAGRDEIGRAAYRILRTVAEGAFGPDDDAPYVAAAALDAHAYTQAQRRLVGPARRAAWERWSQLVPDPARGRLLRLAELSGTAVA